MGAHAFRERFGYWMDQAARGEEIVITRRGRPYARLGPTEVQRELEIDAGPVGSSIAPD